MDMDNVHCTCLLFNVLISLTISSDCFCCFVGCRHLQHCKHFSCRPTVADPPHESASPTHLLQLGNLTLLTNTCSDLIAVASHVIITWHTCYAREKRTSSSRTTLWKGCGKQTNEKSVNNLENDSIPAADVVKLNNRHITFTIPKTAYSNHKFKGNQWRGVFIKNVLSFDLWKMTSCFQFSENLRVRSY